MNKLREKTMVRHVAEKDTEHQDAGFQNNSHFFRACVTAFSISDFFNPTAITCDRACLISSSNSLSDGVAIRFSFTTSFSPTTTNQEPA